MAAAVGVEGNLGQCDPLTAAQSQNDFVGEGVGDPSRDRRIAAVALAENRVAAFQVMETTLEHELAGLGLELPHQHELVLKGAVKLEVTSHVAGQVENPKLLGTLQNHNAARFEVGP